MNKTTMSIGYPQSPKTAPIDSLANAQYFVAWMAIIISFSVCFAILSKLHESCCLARTFKG